MKPLWHANGPNYFQLAHRFLEDLSCENAVYTDPKTDAAKKLFFSLISLLKNPIILKDLQMMTLSAAVMVSPTPPTYKYT